MTFNDPGGVVDIIIRFAHRALEIIGGWGHY